MKKKKYIYGKCPAPEFGTGFVYRQFSMLRRRLNLQPVHSIRLKKMLIVL